MEGCLNCIYSYYKFYYDNENNLEGTYYCDQHEIAVNEADHCHDYIERGELNE